MSKTRVFVLEIETSSAIRADGACPFHVIAREQWQLTHHQSSANELLPLMGTQFREALRIRLLGEPFSSTSTEAVCLCLLCVDDSTSLSFALARSVYWALMSLPWLLMISSAKSVLANDRLIAGAVDVMIALVFLAKNLFVKSIVNVLAYRIEFRQFSLSFNLVEGGYPNV